MKEFLLQNFLDPIAKVWGNAEPLYPATRLKAKASRQKNRNKKSK